METLPPIGLGTMGIEEPEPITTGIEVGYRHLDTAQLYGNEAAVGEGIEASDVPREDLFVATKLWYDTLEYDAVLAATEESKERLGLDTIDLLYVHRPVAEYDPEETLAAFDLLRERGDIRHVGLSNFTVAEMAEAREHLDAPVFAHQIELHPLYYTPELVAEAREHDTHVVAYSPLASARAHEIDAVVEVAEAHGATPEQVSLAWLLEKGVHPIPKASSREHQESNFAATELDLTEAEVERIDAIEREYEIYPE
ncbi:MAG: aldo/keto reductase [Halobacteriaceae archaeon]